MKITPFTKQDFQKLTQLDKIEFLLRTSAVKENIKKSFPSIEIIAVICILAFSRLYSILLVAAFGLTAETTNSIIAMLLFITALLFMFAISFIGRLIIYFQKHKQLSDLHLEFLDRLHLQTTLQTIKSKKK